jgi:AraC-like DNA-binding protein
MTRVDSSAYLYKHTTCIEPTNRVVIQAEQKEPYDRRLSEVRLGPWPVGPSNFLEVLDTGSSAPDRRFDVWEDLVHLVCGPLHVIRNGDDPFYGRIVRTQLGSVQTSLITAAAHTVERTERLIKRSDTAHLYVCAMLSGEARLSQDGQATTIRAGNLVALDSSRPYVLAMDRPFRMIAARFAHSLVGLTPRDTVPLTATAWSGQHGVSLLLSHMLDGMASRMTELSAASADQLGDSVGSLIAALFSERLRDSVADSTAARQALLLRIQSFAREHLGDPSLSPALLARRHNISLRYLQLLFQEQNTSPAKWIRDERLKRCHDDLHNPRFAHLTVASIGERWGLPGASHFSRLFRERYKVTPRECRRQVQQLASLPGL